MSLQREAKITLTTCFWGSLKNESNLSMKIFHVVFIMKRICCLSALFYLFFKLLLLWPKNWVALFSGLHGFVGVGGYKMPLLKL